MFFEEPSQVGCGRVGGVELSHGGGEQQDFHFGNIDIISDDNYPL